MSRRSSIGSRPRRAEARADGEGARALHFDCFSGIAGNMVLGALLDLGLPRRQLEADLAALGLRHRLRVRRVRRGALRACHVEVQVPRARHGHGRRYGEIRALLRRARLEPAVRERALAVFEALAVAEARVHGIEPDEVHFHEVGAVDAIVDVVGAVSGLLRLGVRRVTASPVALGEGQVETEHGRLPLPAPAVLELLRGIPTVPAHERFETATPTGAAILRTLAEGYGALPAMTVEAVGHGAGDDRPTRLPNVLRAVLGRAGLAGRDRVVCLETNLDDFVPEHFDHVMERLFEAGALDVALQHLQMKKNRPGFLLRAIAPPDRRLAVAQVLFAETPTLGVRALECERFLLPRERRRVRLPEGEVAVKVVRGPGGSVEVSAEYDDCRRLARRTGLPLREVVRRAEAAGRALVDKAAVLE
jgi:hypothetical protein